MTLNDLDLNDLNDQAFSAKSRSSMKAVSFEIVK